MGKGWYLKSLFVVLAIWISSPILHAQEIKVRGFMNGNALYEALISDSDQNIWERVGNSAANDLNNWIDEEFIIVFIAIISTIFFLLYLLRILREKQLKKQKDVFRFEAYNPNSLSAMTGESPTSIVLCGKHAARLHKYLMKYSASLYWRKLESSSEPCVWCESPEDYSHI